MLGLALPVIVPGAARAQAQIGFSASVNSDYRYRGVSLSNEKPSLTLSASYDHPSGVYGGVSLSGAATAHDGLQPLGYVLSVGYAVRTQSSASWDFGVTHLAYQDHVTPIYRASSSELYAGVTIQNVSAHLYLSPNYFGEHVRTAYLDLNTARRLTGTWRVFVHGGVLAPISPGAGTEIDQTHYDLRAGVATRIKGIEVQAAWTGATPSAQYLGGSHQAKSAAVLSATYFF